MGKFDGVLIATDIDGTLINSSFELSIENKTAIDYFKAEGGIFTIATGRLCDYLKEKEFDALVNCPVIVLNGAAVYDFETNEFLELKKCSFFSLCFYILETPWQLSLLGIVIQILSRSLK